MLAALGTGVILYWGWPSRFGPDTFDQLHEGMTTDEVGAVLGCPPGDYRPAIWREPTWFVSPSDSDLSLRAERGRSIRDLDLQERKEIDNWLAAGGPEPAPSFYRFHWWGRRYGIEAAFDPSGRLIGWTLYETLRPREPRALWQKPRWVLGV
jgi:hypothetical protein